MTRPTPTHTNVHGTYCSQLGMCVKPYMQLYAFALETSSTCIYHIGSESVHLTNIVWVSCTTSRVQRVNINALGHKFVRYSRCVTI